MCGQADFFQPLVHQKEVLGRAGGPVSRASSEGASGLAWPSQSWRCASGGPLGWLESGRVCVSNISSSCDACRSLSPHYTNAPVPRGL